MCLQTDTQMACTLSLLIHSIAMSVQTAPLIFFTCVIWSTSATRLSAWTTSTCHYTDVITDLQLSIHDGSMTLYADYIMLYHPIYTPVNYV